MKKKMTRTSKASTKGKPRTVADLYTEGENGERLDGKYTERTDIHELIQRRHLSGMSRINEDGYYESDEHLWKVPYGVRQALRTRLYWTQIASKYPYYTTWTSPRTGVRLRKKHMSLVHAIHFIATRAQYVDPHASIIARHGFYIPTKLMGKFPRKMGDPPRTHYWCPRCMEPRRFRRTGQTFFQMKKFWNEEKGRYDWKNVELALMECTVCTISNRDAKFRASNQPVEKRRFKRGVRRARRRR